MVMVAEAVLQLLEKLWGDVSGPSYRQVVSLAPLVLGFQP